MRMARKNTTSSRLQRNVKEKVRRLHMKNLLAKLASLVHPDPSTLSGPEVLVQATSHVKQLQGRIEELRNRRMETQSTVNNSTSSARIPVMEIRSRDEVFEVNLITGLRKNFMFHEVINVIQEEGAEITSFTQFNDGDCVFHIIRAKAISAKIGIEMSTIEEKLKEVVY